MPAPFNGNLGITNMKRRPRYSKDSTYNHVKLRQVQEYGKSLQRERAMWTSSEVDRLLEAFLVQKLPLLSKGKCILKVCKRSRGAITTALWKIATNYDRAIIRDYVPQKRTQRFQEPFNERELVLLAAATHPIGRFYGGYQAEHLAKIFAREPAVVQKLLDAMWQRKQKGTLQLLGPSVYNQDAAKLVHEYVVSLVGTFQMYMKYPR